MASYIKYNSETGEILAAISCPENMIGLQIDNAEAYLTGTADDITQYVNVETKTVTDKPGFPAAIDKTGIQANAIDVATISGLPNSTTVIVSEMGTYTVDDSTFEFTVDTPGEYRIKCSAFPYLDKEFIINAS